MLIKRLSRNSFWNMNAAMANSESFLLRFKEQDGISGITSETFDKLCKTLNMSKTAVIHKALMDIAPRFIDVDTDKISS